MSVRQKRAGQGVVEFALALPILVLLVLGVLDLGRAFQMYIVVSNSAREGAYFLSMHPTDRGTCGTGGAEPNPAPGCYDGTVQVIKDEGSNSGLTINRSDITINHCCTKGLPVEVKVHQQFTLTVVGLFAGPTQINHSVRMVVQSAP